MKLISCCKAIAVMLASFAIGSASAETIILNQLDTVAFETTHDATQATTGAKALSIGGTMSLSGNINASINQTAGTVTVTVTPFAGPGPTLVTTPPGLRVTV